MAREILSGELKGVKFKYAPHTEEDESSGILIINLPNNVESTHIIKNWGLMRIMQYIESMQYFV